MSLSMTWTLTPCAPFPGPPDLLLCCPAPWICSFPLHVAPLVSRLIPVGSKDRARSQQAALAFLRLCWRPLPVQPSSVPSPPLCGQSPPLHWNWWETPVVLGRNPANSSRPSLFASLLDLLPVFPAIVCLQWKSSKSSQTCVHAENPNLYRAHGLIPKKCGFWTLCTAL